MKILFTTVVLILSFPCMAGKFPLPKEGQEVSLQEIKQICLHFNLPKLWEKIETSPPNSVFKSDGCTAWFDQWQGKDLYPACFIHDLQYWAGKPNESIERLKADTDLMLSVADILGDTKMAEAMFHGVRLGGDGLFKTSYTWGFGRD